MISVCIAAYNGEKYIREQIFSILSQLNSDDEVIISDDGSKDGTIAILESFHDQRIRIYSNEGTHGFVSNFENALLHAKGDFIFLSDQDDVWKQGKIEKCMKTLSEYDLIVHDAELIDGNGMPLGRNYYDSLHRHTGFIMNLYKTRWLGCCMAFRREVLSICLPFPPKIVAHDYWIGMFGMTKFRYKFMDDILISYRRHGNNLSPSSEKSNTTILYKLFEKRLYTLIEIAKRIMFTK